MFAQGWFPDFHLPLLAVCHPEQKPSALIRVCRLAVSVDAV
jgi:hypothetical protein